MQFSDRLFQRIQKTSSLVIGIDPNFDLMPKELLPKASSPEGIRDALIQFSKINLDATQDLACAVKFQSSYFEQFGLAGLEALKASIEYAREKQFQVILDAKRGDIGSTSLAYAQAYLSGGTTLSNSIFAKSDFEVDCLTVNPFLGEDSILPFIETALTNNKGLFILVKTSNPDSKLVMDSTTTSGKTVSEALSDMVQKYSFQQVGECGFGNIGCVVGATYPEEAEHLRKRMPNVTFLVPGVGAQGASVDMVKSCFTEAGQGAIIPISRGITYPSKEDISIQGYANAVRTNASEYFKLIQSLIV